jgi:cytochrome oxidase assembly protein ShyY1
MHQRREADRGSKSQDWFRFVLQMVVPILVACLFGLGGWALALERSKADKSEILETRVQFYGAIQTLKNEIVSDLQDVKEELRWNRKFHETGKWR